MRPCSNGGNLDLIFALRSFLLTTFCWVLSFYVFCKFCSPRVLEGASSLFFKFSLRVQLKKTSCHSVSSQKSLWPGAYASQLLFLASRSLWKRLPKFDSIAELSAYMTLVAFSLASSDIFLTPLLQAPLVVSSWVCPPGSCLLFKFQSQSHIF